MTTQIELVRLVAAHEKDRLPLLLVCTSLEVFERIPQDVKNKLGLIILTDDDLRQVA